MTFIFDEQLPNSIVAVLVILQERLNKRMKTSHRVEHITQRFPAGTKDPDFISEFPADGVLITMDIGQQRKWQERILIEKNRVNVIYYRSKKSLSYWQLVILFINSWWDVLEFCASHTKPFFLRYKPADVRKFTHCVWHIDT